MLPKKSILIRLVPIIFILVMGCSKDEAPSDDFLPIDNFYGESLNSATLDGLSGVWAIFNAQFNGEVSEIPIVYDSCGRDFFVYSKDGTYTEYLYQNSSCEPKVNLLDWQLQNGVITLSNSFGQSDDLVITRLNEEELIFKSRFDVDEDGTLDVLLLFAKRYKPIDVDLVTRTFTENRDESYENLLSFTWEMYDGFNDFVRYEIYRSGGDNCTKSNAELIATLTDASMVEYTDLTPPESEKLCYFLRVYTSEGLLGESRLYDVVPEFKIRIDPTEMHEPVIQNDQILINWNASDSPYFSHYEISYSDKPSSSSQEYTVAIIDDLDITTYTDENPPYFKNPVYRVYVHNIFGNRSPANTEETTVFWEVPFKRQEIIELNDIESFAIDPEEPIIYFHGRNKEDDDDINIHRFNYNTHQVEHISDIPPTTYTELPIKVVVSPNGKEIVIEQGIELHFYDAETMQYKYAIDPEEVFSISDFLYHPDLDLWSITDNDTMYTFKRDNTNLNFKDSRAHFSEHQGGGAYQPYALSNNRLIVGHRAETNSMVYALDANGTILSDQTVPLHLKNLNNDKILYNATANYFLDITENRLYSSETFASIQSFEMPVFPSGTSTDGNTIYGTNNDPDWQVTSDSPHKTEAILFNRNTGQTDKIELIGYPLLIFENYVGDIMSISSGLKKNRLIDYSVYQPSLFIEKIASQ